MTKKDVLVSAGLSSSRRKEVKMKILEIQDIVERYQVTYYQARKWLNLRGCPVLPRGRGGRYRVLKDEFERWLKNSKAI